MEMTLIPMHSSPTCWRSSTHGRVYRCCQRCGRTFCISFVEKMGVVIGLPAVSWSLSIFLQTLCFFTCPPCTTHRKLAYVHFVEPIIAGNATLDDTPHCIDPFRNIYTYARISLWSWTLAVDAFLLPTKQKPFCTKPPYYTPHSIPPQIPLNHVLTNLPSHTAHRGTVICAGGYTRQTAINAIESGHCDLIAFGRSFLANPDLPKRLELDAALNEPDPSTFYAPGDKGVCVYGGHLCMYVF